MNRKLLVGLVAGVLVVLGGVVGYGAWKVDAAAKEQARVAEVLSTTRAVDDIMTGVWSELADCDQAWTMAAADDVTVLRTVLLQSKDDLAFVSDEVAKARETIATIPSDEVQTAYLAVCDELDSVVQQALTDSEEATPLSDAHALLLDADDFDRDGWLELNDSITACNRSEYKDGKAKAAASEAKYRKMRTAYEDAYDLCGLEGIKTAYQYIDASIKAAEMQHELAVLGGKGSINGYNKQIGKLEKQEKLVDSLKDLPVDSKMAVWTRAQEAYGDFESRAGTAKKQWEVARDLVSSGDY